MSNSFAISMRIAIEMIGDSMIPRKHRTRIHKYLERTGRLDIPYYEYGIATVSASFLSIGLAVILLSTKFFDNANFLIKALLTLALSPVIFMVLASAGILLYWYYLETKISYKVRKMEEVFPEFLSELELNLKSGQSLEESIGNSTEKEFGFLAIEMNRVYQKVKLGMELDKAIKEFTDDYDSEVMEETLGLIVTSWNKGAATSKVVERIHENLTVIRYLKRKVIASVTSYRIFLAMVTLIIAPAVFAMSYYIIRLARDIIGKIVGISSGAYMPIAINSVSINIDHFRIFSILTLIVMASSTAIAISIIKTGSIREGYKQIALFSVLAYISYTIFMYLFNIFFSAFNV